MVFVSVNVDNFPTKKFQIQTVGQTEESIIMSEFYISNPYRQLDRHST